MSEQDKVSEYTAKCKELQKTLLAAYKELTDNISEDSIKPLADCFESEMKKKVEGSLVEKLRANIYNRLEKGFLENWDAVNLDASFATLSILNNIYYKDDTDNKWRPTGKTVEDQAIPSVYKATLKKKMVLKRLLDNQREVLNTLVPIIEEKRNILKDSMEKRKSFLAKLNEDLKNSSEEYEIDLKATESNSQDS
ncbi:CLUMA_CG006342, isoform A [Clunio marinus]|uniref:CLUMA_CG006342, isoform A n=1 Tax=Clunio marinus TaxID=568069 RepID=A0A1J1HXZ9_9DIPT|nr:CLUMA_CG006342, isoform A [Clunio marinus]